MGVRWNPDTPAGAGVTVVAVEPGSAAARGGLAVGDRIVQFAGVDVDSPAHFRSLVLAARNPVAVRVLRGKNAEPVELTLTLVGNPSRLGITWRGDDAEPGVVILNRVLPGSAAEAAGLHVNDRIYRVAGRDFATADDFRDLITSAGRPRSSSRSNRTARCARSRSTCPPNRPRPRPPNRAASNGRGGRHRPPYSQGR